MFGRMSVIAAVALMALGCGGANGPDGGAAGEGTGAESAEGEGGRLSQAEIDSLLFMREEEKLARDVYAALDGYGNPFVNIQESEQRHMDAVLALIDAHGLEDPADGTAPGEFRNADLQRLYGELVAKGTSEIAALSVGCAIEELDIRDIEEAKGKSTHGDVIATYDMLLLGSRNHLRAFYGKLLKRGGRYTPQFIDQVTFDTIVASSHERP